MLESIGTIQEMLKEIISKIEFRDWKATNIKFPYAFVWLHLYYMIVVRSLRIHTNNI